MCKCVYMGSRECWVFEDLEKSYLAAAQKFLPHVTPAFLKLSNHGGRDVVLLR